ncbi:MAG: hypothetical protein K0S55_417 [Clostridia bacterium]|jgi:hypothetical protein|nr:hypothetical protein [Clostridia bacterium]
MEIFFIVCGVFVLLVILAINLNKKTEEKNKNFMTKLLETGFKIDKTIAFGNNHLFIDNLSKKWCVREGQNYDIKIYDYKDLISYELVEDGNSIMKGRAGSALAGGLLFGGVGAIVGASLSKEIKSTCTILQLHIQVNNLDKPQIVMKFIQSETKKDSILYKVSMENARNMTAALAFINNENESTEPLNIKENNIDDKLRQLLKLKEDGILTEDEYNEKKKDLLTKL